jgi:phenylacetate-CoA ligase
MAGWKDHLYCISPVWVQQIGVNAFGWYWARRRLGPAFEAGWRDYVEREAWPTERLREFVDQRLREQVRRAYREVPYYREAFRRHGVLESLVDHFTVDDLPQLPLLEKAAVRADPALLLTERAAKDPPASFATSGTTGTPIRVFWDVPTQQENIAVREARSFRWAGVSYRESRSTIGGRLVVPRAVSQPPFWRYNHWERQVYFSAFHISPVNIPDYVYALNRFRPVTMTGYASANFFLARLIGEMGLEVHSPRSIITGSERLEPEMRAVMERVFRTRAYEEYGSVENCSLATECERGRLHVHLDFGYMEILRSDGTPAAPGEVGEVVVTGFANKNQVFLRYRIGDLASWATEPCACGRQTLPVIGELVGRQEDTVVGSDGREMVRFHGLFIDLPGVAEGQVVQEELDRFVVHLVPTPSYSGHEPDEIRARMRTRLGPDISVDVRKIQAIPREANGKFRAVISRVKRKPAERADLAVDQLARS